MAYTSKIKVSIEVTGTKTDELANLNGSASISHSATYASGAASGQIDSAFTDDRTLTSSGTHTYDLGTSMSDIFGTAFAFSKIKALAVKNSGTNPLTVAGDSLGIATGSVTLPAGACLLLDFGPAGISVTAESADELTVASALGTTYQLIISGVKAA